MLSVLLNYLQEPCRSGNRYSIECLSLVVHCFRIPLLERELVFILDVAVTSQHLVQFVHQTRPVYILVRTSSPVLCVSGSTDKDVMEHGSGTAGKVVSPINVDELSVALEHSTFIIVHLVIGHQFRTHLFGYLAEQPALGVLEVVVLLADDTPPVL